MFRTDRVCVWIFIIMFGCLTLSKVITFTDELFSMLLGTLAALDCIVNGKPGRYKVLWIIIGVLVFYAVYSLVFVDFNNAGAIMGDFVIQIKPFLPFTVFLAIRPQFTEEDKQIVRWIAIFNVLFCSFFMYLMPSLLVPVLQYITYPGLYIFISAIVYVFCSQTKEGKIPRINMIYTVGMLLLGLGCTRSKYFGMFVLALFFFFIYRPGMLRHITLSYSIVFAILITAVLAVSWTKIDLYFIDGVQLEGAEIDVESSVARPALYGGAGLIVADYPLFGSGLASYATFYSSPPNYSRAYGEYGLDRVYGLSEDYPAFISDAFYAELAQFGIVGIILFIWFWVYICRILKKEIRLNEKKNKFVYICGVLCVCFLLIEGIAATTFIQATGMITMMLLGMICGLLPQYEEKQERTSAERYPECLQNRYIIS